MCVPCLPTPLAGGGTPPAREIRQEDFYRAQYTYDILGLPAPCTGENDEKYYCLRMRREMMPIKLPEIAGIWLGSGSFITKEIKIKGSAELAL